MLYAGNATTKAVTNVGFPPDFVWVKNRTLASDNVLQDKVRGNYQTLISNKTNAENTNSALDWFRSFDSDGFTVGHPVSGGGSETSEWNANNSNYVSWNWKANGSGSTNTVGSLDSVVSANAAAGFSIVTYTGNGSAQSIGHGLSKDLELIFVKNREATSSWVTQWVGNPLADYMYLNDTRGQSTTTIFNLDITRSNDGTFYYGVAQYLGANNIDYVAYCFHSVAGYSKIGEYTGNGNASGPMVNLGFKPAWVMVKRTDVAKDWIILDVKRDIDNVANHRLFPNLSDAEATAQLPMDILSNGFKLRISDSNYNANAGTYLYLAFAESPQKTATAR